MLPLGFGIGFQLPLVMLFLERIGVFTHQGYLSSWRIAVLAIFVLAMVLTPTGDPIQHVLMAVPLTLLYFGGILLCSTCRGSGAGFGSRAGVERRSVPARKRAPRSCGTPVA